MENFNLWEFLGITVFLFGAGAFLMGQALAETWRHIGWSLPYGLMLAAANHFLDAALFTRAWGSYAHFILDFIIILLITILSYRLTLARKMVRQYPWIYEQAGPLSWRKK